VLATYDPATSRWQEQAWTRWVVWLPFYAALARAAWRARGRGSEPGDSALGDVGVVEPEAGVVETEGVKNRDEELVRRDP
jgi:hypothetical protein